MVDVWAAQHDVLILPCHKCLIPNAFIMPNRILMTAIELVVSKAYSTHLAASSHFGAIDDLFRNFNGMGWK